MLLKSQKLGENPIDHMPGLIQSVSQGTTSNWREANNVLSMRDLILFIQLSGANTLAVAETQEHSSQTLLSGGAV